MLRQVKSQRMHLESITLHWKECLQPCSLHHSPLRILKNLHCRFLMYIRRTACYFDVFLSSGDTKKIIL
jgi:hypothetical protein